jgi:hypothetical protein
MILFSFFTLGWMYQIPIGTNARRNAVDKKSFNRASLFRSALTSIFAVVEQITTDKMIDKNKR